MTKLVKDPAKDGSEDDSADTLQNAPPEFLEVIEKGHLFQRLGQIESVRCAAPPFDRLDRFPGSSGCIAKSEQSHRLRRIGFFLFVFAQVQFKQGIDPNPVFFHLRLPAAPCKVEERHDAGHFEPVLPEL